MIVDLPYTAKIKYPLKTDFNFLGGTGDGFLYQGNKDRTSLQSLEIEYENLTHEEAGLLVADVYSGLAGGNRLRFDGKFFSGTGDFITEEWNFSFVKVKLNLQEVK